MTRWLVVLVLVCAVACQGIVEDAPHHDDPNDEGTGTEIVSPEADPGPACAEPESCGEPPGVVVPPPVNAGSGSPAVQRHAVGVEEVDGIDRVTAVETLPAAMPPAEPPAPASASPYVVGATLITRTYTSFRHSASSTGALLTDAPPHGGVTDSEHEGGMTRGLLSPGQEVELVDADKNNGFWKVKYAGLTGWVAASRLAPMDPSVHPVEFALRPALRNAFYKNQLHRSLWNKDGPRSSGNCAPTSLAMAVRVFGKEPAHLSVEQSIHRVRHSYGDDSDSGGTRRSQIKAGAVALGLHVKELATRLSTTAMLSRIDDQLDLKRVVVLEGQPGSTYRSAFTRAAHADGKPSYTFTGRHTIAVLGHDTDGGYVVGDPISEVGMLTITASELKSFITSWGGTGNAVWD